MVDSNYLSRSFILRVYKIYNLYQRSQNSISRPMSKGSYLSNALESGLRGLGTVERECAVEL